MKRFLTFVLLLLAFVLSVMARWPQLNRPLSKHHEFCTAIALRVMQVWDQGGIANYHFSPAMNYPGRANAFIQNDASSSGRMVDDKGTFYYISHPPLAYYVPYGVFQLFGLEFNEANIRGFHLVFHFLCGLVVFLIAFVLLEGSLLPAFAAYLVYLSNPATLWFQSNVFMSDMFVQIFFAIGVLLFVLWLRSNRSQGLLVVAFGAATFLMTYTTWLGCFVALVVFCWGLLNWKTRSGWKLATASAIGCALALGLILFQYSQVNGMEAMFDEWFNRVKIRSGYSSAIGSVFFLKGFFQNAPAIALNYLTSYASVFVLIVTLLILNLLKGISVPKHFKEFAMVSVVPIVLLHLVLSDYSGHDFTTLWAAVFLSVLIGALINNAISNAKVRIQLFRLALLCAVIIGCFLGLAQFHYINRPGEVSQSGDHYDLEMKAATLLTQEIQDHETLFVIGQKPTPQMIYFAERNIRLVAYKPETVDFLYEQNVNSGRLYSLSKIMK